MAVANYNDFNQGRAYEDVISELNDRVEALELHLAWEAELRKQNPALQDLFEKFQTTKNLIK